MKSYYFISGLPRSGSTMLSSILRQNPDFYADIASPVDSITRTSIETITRGQNNLTVSENQRKNLMYGIFEGYYKDVQKNTVFDSSRGWTNKTNFLKDLFPYTKILCPVRDIVSIVNSLEIINAKNPLYANTMTNNYDNIFSRCEEYLCKDTGLVAKSWVYLREGYCINPQMIYFVQYDDLCKDPETTIKKIYEFLEKPYYPHDFNNLDYSNELFDIGCNLKDLHTVRKKIEYIPQKCILPKEVIEKCNSMDMEFWKDDKIEKKYLEYN